MARTKCDAAHRPTSGQANGTANTSRADAWTTQNTTIETVVISKSDLSESTGHGNPRRADRGQETAGCAHQPGEEEAAGEQRRGNTELERDFGETDEVGRSGRPAVNRKRQQAPDDAAN